MKKQFLALVFLSMLISASAVAQKGKGYNFTVKIQGLHDTLAYLAYHYGDKQYLKDTAEVNAKGVMVFKGDEALPGGIYMIVMPSKNYFEFIMKEQTGFSLETDSSDLVGKMKVKGSPENELFYEYLKYVASKGKEVEALKKDLGTAKSKEDSTKIREQIGKVDQEVIDYRDKYIEQHGSSMLAKVFMAMKDPVVPESVDSTQKFAWYKAHYFDNIDFSDDRIVRSPVFHNKLKQYFEKMTLQTPDSVQAAAAYLIEKARASKELFKYTTYYVTYTIETSNIMCMDQAFVYVVDHYYKTGEAFWLNEKQTKKIIDKADKLRNILCGSKAPNLVMPDTSGKIQVLDKISADYTVLIFWDPNCGHCKKAVPKLRDEIADVKPEYISVYAVCIENNEADWKKFIQKEKLPFINVWDPYHQTNFRALYDITSTPTILILDKNKEIIGKQLGVEQIKDFIKRYSEVQAAKEKQKEK